MCLNVFVCVYFCLFDGFFWCCSLRSLFTIFRGGFIGFRSGCVSVHGRWKGYAARAVVCDFVQAYVGGGGRKRGG